MLGLTGVPVSQGGFWSDLGHLEQGTGGQAGCRQDCVVEKCLACAESVVVRRAG